jgi:hypothetical protein
MKHKRDSFSCFYLVFIQVDKPYIFLPHGHLEKRKSVMSKRDSWGSEAKTMYFVVMITTPINFQMTCFYNNCILKKCLLRT